MRFLLTAIVILTIGSGSFAQDLPTDIWHEGKLILVNETILEGKIKYDMVRGLVQVDTNGKVYTHGAKSIFYFKIYDETIESHREFYVLPYGLITSYKAPVIFEVLVEGNLTLLSREYTTTKNVQSSSPYNIGGYQGYQKEVLVYDYFFLDRKGNITQYNMKKKELMAAVSKRQSEVTDYMRQTKLRPDRRNDLIRIIAFYNALL